MLAVFLSYASEDREQKQLPGDPQQKIKVTVITKALDRPSWSRVLRPRLTSAHQADGRT